jgi:hypothetical protein
VASKDLPPDFAKIPPDSKKGWVLMSVAGTEQSRDAVHESFIPQTAVIDRKKAKLIVKYDGEPLFEAIKGTNLKYAINTSYAVFLLDRKYYCCYGAVWYQSESALGPWRVCDDVPDEIYTVPPSNPHYYTKYARVYDSNPDNVWVGYTPGYTGSYVQEGTMVFGTGYDYDQYDYDANYEDFSYEEPDEYSWLLGGGYYGWYGYYDDRDASGYATREGPLGTWEASFYAKWEDGNLTIWRDITFTPNENLYDNREEVKNNFGSMRAELQAKREQSNRPGSKGGVAKAQDRAGQPGPRKNNVYTDKNGRIWRQTPEGWQKREKGRWSGQVKPDGRTPGRAGPDARPAPPQNLQQQQKARARAAQRTRQFNARPPPQQRPQPPRPPPPRPAPRPPPPPPPPPPAPPPRPPPQRPPSRPRRRPPAPAVFMMPFKQEARLALAEVLEGDFEAVRFDHHVRG